LVFPHHENEVAQSRSAHGTPLLARYWMHNGFLLVDGEKMSKSLGNFITLREVLQQPVAANVFDAQGPWGALDRKFNGLAAKLLMLRTHYRQPINWTSDGFIQAQNDLVGLLEVVQRGLGGELSDLSRRSSDAALVPDAEVLGALSDDLNTALASNLLAQRIKHNRLDEALGAMNMLGLLDHDLVAANDYLRFERRLDNTQAIVALVNARHAARKAKNFAEADRIRRQLAGMGIRLKDAKDPVSGEVMTSWELQR
jgi:cysteinyl-tRNA synthetase